MYINSYLMECVGKEHHADLLRKAGRWGRYRLSDQQPSNTLIDWLAHHWNGWQQRQRSPARPWVLPSELAKIKQIG